MPSSLRSALLGALFGALLGLCVVGCGSSPPPPVVRVEETIDAGVEVPVVVVDAGQPPPKRPPLSPTASYEEALSAPEEIDALDDRAHLTDLQLTNPMRDVLAGCRVPRRAKVTIKVAIQTGRAIGVTVLVDFEKPKGSRPMSPAAVKYEAKAKAKLADCADRAVRGVTWPPSPRRDSFTTQY